MKRMYALFLLITAIFMLSSCGADQPIGTTVVNDEPEEPAAVVEAEPEPTAVVEEVVEVVEEEVMPTAEPELIIEEESAEMEAAEVEAAEVEAEEAELVEDSGASIDFVVELWDSFDPITGVEDSLVLYGRVLDVNGDPVVGTAVEIWQTDENGSYDHPDDPSTDDRNLDFQFFGTATVDENGFYLFRTKLPGEYEPRPRHIHFKVKQSGATMLTSQFYFSDDIAQVEDEGIFSSAGEDGNLLLLQLVESEGGLLAYGEIVVDTGIGAGDNTLTPSQTEGPFYPVLPVENYDNDLLILP